MFKKDFYLVKNVLQIAFPIILGNLGFIMIGVGDVIVAGRHSTETLVAISLANAILMCIMTFGIGIMSSISPVLSNYRGEGHEPEKYFYPSLKFAMLIAFFTSVIIFAAIPFIKCLGFETHLTNIIKDYFLVTAFSTFGGFLHFMSKEFLQAFEIVMFPNLLNVFCIFLNVVLNIIFVFGFGCIPEMGAIGLAIASLIVRYFMGIVLFIYCYKKIQIKCCKNDNVAYYNDLLRVGLPSSFAVMVEFVAFNSITIIVGKISDIYAGVQNIINTITTVSYMVPFAISNAVSIKVGYTNGAKNFSRLKKYALVGIKMSTLFMLFSIVVMGVFAHQIARLFTTDSMLITLSIPIIYILCFFQIFDGLQVTLSGIFRGLKHTKIVLAANFVGYWLIALPVGSFLAFRYNLNLQGYWFGLIISAIVLCAILFSALNKEFKKMR